MLDEMIRSRFAGVTIGLQEIGTALVNAQQTPVTASTLAEIQEHVADIQDNALITLQYLATLRALCEVRDAR